VEWVQVPCNLVEAGFGARPLRKGRRNEGEGRFEEQRQLTLGSVRQNVGAGCCMWSGSGRAAWCTSGPVGKEPLTAQWQLDHTEGAYGMNKNRGGCTGGGLYGLGRTVDVNRPQCDALHKVDPFWVGCALSQPGQPVRGKVKFRGPELTSLVLQSGTGCRSSGGRVF
jgi:hypothetical protein